MLFAKFATQFSINAGSRYFYRTPNSTFEDRKNREQIPVFKSFTRFAHDARKYRRYEFPSTNRLSDFFSRRRQPQYRVYDGFMKCRHYASKKSDNGGIRTPSGGSDKPSKQATVNKQPAKGKGKSSGDKSAAKQTPKSFGDKSANKQTAKSSGDKSAAKQTPKSSGDKSAPKQTAKSPDKSAKSPKKSGKAPIKSAKSPNKSDKTPNKSDKTEPSDKRKIKPKKRCVCGNGKPKKKDKDKTTQTNPESKKSGKDSKGSKKGLQLRTTQDEYDIQLNTEFAQMTSEKISVAIIGSGNWGTAIAKIIGENAKKLRDFNDRVNMWVHAEQVNGKSLTDIINETHENVKYLKGIKLPNNVFALTDVGETAKNAQILVFVLPHQFIPNVCESMKGKIKKDATAVSLIKGFGLKKDGGIELITRIIENHLNIPCSSLIGANIALGVAKGEFSESTLGCRDPRYAMKLRQIFQTDFFRISVVHKSDGVEICGALKNIVAIAVGFCDGMKLGNNTKAAVIRLGLMEMIHFIDEFFPGTDISVYFESCGIADLITTCFGGRNRSVSAAFVTQNKSFEELELEMLSGQKLQGPLTADEVNQFLKAKKSEHKYPLFTTVHLISTGKLKPQDLIKNIRKHPEHVRSMKAYLKAYRASVKK